MTQMLLFDSASSKHVVPVAEVASRREPKSESPEGENIASRLEHDSGLNHMGDLARLVLLRYELVAKRRAQLAARRAAK